MGKFTPTSTGITTRRVGVDEDLYDQLTRIKDELLSRKKLRIPEKNILNVILAEELTTYSEEDFNNLIESVVYLIEKWS